jgi:Glyoxalase-like domain
MNKFVLTRREILRLIGAPFLVNLSTEGRSMAAPEKLVPAAKAVDHLLLGASDLDQGIAWVEKTTTVKAIAGGSHPGVGTRNALLSLGGKQYLEIIAPDPAQTAFNFQIDVRKLAVPRLITWAAVTSDINSIAKRAQETGYQIFGPRDGSRARPDGKTLKWKTMGVMNTLGVQGVEPVPFFIEWAAESLHPSQDSPQGCRLSSIELEHPDPAGVRATLEKLGIGIEVKQAKEARLKAALDTPKGRVVLG